MKSHFLSALITKDIFLINELNEVNNLQNIKNFTKYKSQQFYRIFLNSKKKKKSIYILEMSCILLRGEKNRMSQPRIWERISRFQMSKS